VEHLQVSISKAQNREGEKGEKGEERHGRTGAEEAEVFYLTNSSITGKQK
jgi:hypothetical protein